MQEAVELHVKGWGSPNSHSPGAYPVDFQLFLGNKRCVKPAW